MRLKHFLSVFLTLLTLSVGQMWGVGTTVRYTASGATSVSTTGTAPTGSSASLSGSGTYSSPWIQCTNGNGKTLTLSGYEGYKITAITIYVKSNSSKGTGSFSVSAGSTSLASIAENAFNNAAWNGSWNNSGVTKSLTMTNSNYEIKKNENVTLTINCKSGSSNYNSLYIQYWEITYEAAATGCTGTKLGTPSVTAEASNQQVRLTWSAVDNASSYQLKWNGGDWTAATSPVTKTNLNNGTAYTYQVKAIGNGSTYCDGDASAEASATPNVYYTITWNNNGSEYTTTQVVSGQRPTFPEAPSSCDAGEGASTTFYGWATSTWSGKVTSLEDSKLSGITIYTKASDMPTVTGNGTVYHAVFCKGGGGSVTITNKMFTDALSASYSTVNIISGDYTFEVNACKQDSKCQMRDNATLSYIAIPTLPGVISRITSTTVANGSGGSYNSILHFKHTKTRGNANTNDIAKLDCSSSAITSLDWDLSSNTTYTSGYLLTSGGLRLSDLTIYYGSAGTNYMTNCCTELGSINGSFFWTTHFCPVWPVKH